MRSSPLARLLVINISIISQVYHRNIPIYTRGRYIRGRIRIKIRGSGLSEKGVLERGKKRGVEIP